MSRRHIVTRGECISSIAHANGFAPTFLWDHPDNEDLREKRGSPNVLRPGDVVAIPDKEVTDTPCQTGKRHTFRRKGVPEKLRFQFLFGDEPRADEPYRMEIDGVVVAEEARTDEEGRIEHSISPEAREARVRFLETEDEYVFTLGHIDPVETVAGVKGRLKSLGFYVGDIDGADDEAFHIAVATYQAERGLEPTGVLDDATRRALSKDYGA